MSNASKSFLSGGGPKALAFPTPGTSHTGTITEDPVESQQIDFDSGEKKTWQDGNPMMQLVVTVDTGRPENEDDDGIRRLFVKGALRKAFQAALAEADCDELLPGGQVTVTYTHDGEKTGRGFPPKQYVVQYVPPKSGSNGAGALASTSAAVPSVPSSVPVPANLPKGMTPEIWATLSPDAQAALAAL
jgi:hypothetical protein